MNTSDYRRIGELKIGDTFRLKTGEELIVRERTTGSCGECYFAKFICDWDCPWFSVVTNDGQFRNILYCENNCCDSPVYYKRVGRSLRMK